MSQYQTGIKNGMWKGGRVIASNGYVLIRVGKSHHLADVRGYAYEHRLVAEQKLDRRLATGEQIHHIDGNQQNNDPTNLFVTGSLAEHRRLHRNDFTCGLLEVIKEFPCGLQQLVEITEAPAKKIGWALTRLRRAGQAHLNRVGAWVGV